MLTGQPLQSMFPVFFFLLDNVCKPSESNGYLEVAALYWIQKYKGSLRL